MVGAQTEWFCGTPREAAEKDTMLRGGGVMYIYTVKCRGVKLWV